MKFGFRDIFIYLTGLFTATYMLSVVQMNFFAVTYSAIGIIVSLIFAMAYSHQSHEENEIKKQLKNARKIHEK